MPKIYVKPNTVAGELLKVRLPDKPLEFMPVDGMSVEKNSHWLRRLNDGSVVMAKAPKAAKPTKE